MIRFALSNNKSAVGANKGGAIVNIHKDTRSGGDTDDTVIRVVVVTVVDSSDISGECTRFVSEQSREHVRASRYLGNIQETRMLCENARSARNYPITKRLVACQQGTHVHCDGKRDSEMKLEKRRRRPTPESRSGESCWHAVRKSERRHLST